MAEDNFTLTTFYTSWKAYQDHIKGVLVQALDRTWQCIADCLAR